MNPAYDSARLSRWASDAMQLAMDKAGRLVVPKPLRDALGLGDGGTVDVTLYGAGLHLVPSGPTAPMVWKNGRLVIASTTPIDNETVLALIDSGRR